MESKVRKLLITQRFYSESQRVEMNSGQRRGFAGFLLLHGKWARSIFIH